MTRFNVNDVTDAISQSNTIFNVVLAPNVEAEVTIPEHATYAIFTATSDFWVKINAIAAITVPAATDTTHTSSNPELNPLVRMVTEGSIISLISPSAASVSIAFYS